MNSPFEKPENKLRNVGFSKSTRSPVLQHSVVDSRGVFHVPLGIGLGFSGVNTPEVTLRTLSLQARLGLNKPTESSLNRLSRLWFSYGNIGNQSPLTGKEIRELIVPMGITKEGLTSLSLAKAWGRATGLNPVIINSSLLSKEDEVYSTILSHEKIHAVHFSSPENPFFERKIKELPNFKSLLEEKVARPGVVEKIKSLENSGQKESYIKTLVESGYLKSGTDEEFNSFLLREQKKNVQQLYSAQLSKASKYERQLMVKSERLAYGLQDSSEFVNEMKVGGLLTFDERAEELVKQHSIWTDSIRNSKLEAIKVVSSGHIAPNRVAQIEGLAEKGLASKLRKLFTHFGSPWQGQTPDSLSNWFSSQARLADKRTPIQRFFGLGRNKRVEGGTFPIPTLSISRKEYEYVSREIFGHITEPPRFIAQGVEQAVFSIGANKVVKIGHGKFTIPPKIPQFLQPIQSGQSGNLFYHVMPKVREGKFLSNIYTESYKGEMSAKTVRFHGILMEKQRELETSILSQGYVFRDAHPGNLAMMKRRLVVTDWGFTEGNKDKYLLRETSIRLRDLLAKKGADVRDPKVIADLARVKKGRWFPGLGDTEELIKMHKPKNLNVQELRIHAAEKLKQEIKVVKKIMSNGEGSSRVGTGIYNSIARGVRRFKGI